MEQVVKEITQEFFGTTPFSIEEILGKGVVNLVYKISVNNADYILRMATEKDALTVYQKEQWCMNQVLQIGIPTPKPYGVGQRGDYAYSFQEYIPGVHGGDAPEECERIWRTLGTYANQFNRIPCPNYKRNLDELDNKLFRSDFFEEYRILTKTKVDLLKARLDQVRSWKYSSMLCHANLNPKNVVVHPSGTIYLVDWGTASGSRAPHEELADMFAWNTGKGNIKIFLDGYGSSSAQVDEMMHDIQTLILSRMVNVLHFKVVHNPKWAETEFAISLMNHLNTIDDFQAKILFSKNI